MSSRHFILLLVSLLIVGCGSTPPQATRVPKVRVEWIGHHCFRITSSLGIVLVTDPFDPKTIPYPVPPNFKAAIVTVSHESELANHANLLENAPQIIRTNMGIGSNRASGMLVRGVASSESPNGIGQNVSYTWEMDGIRFCHLGPITRALTPAQAQQIGRPDVLFLPVGGPSLLTDSARDKILQLLQPRIVVPMGYQTRYTSKIIVRPASTWLATQENVQRIPVSNFSVTRENLPFTRTIIVPSIP